MERLERGERERGKNKKIINFGGGIFKINHSKSRLKMRLKKMAI
jgi:hypothetical protein